MSLCIWRRRGRPKQDNAGIGRLVFGVKELKIEQARYISIPTTNYYTVNGEIIGERTAGSPRVDYLTDALGSVTATVNQSGQVVNTYRYKPYGELLAKTGGGPDPAFGWVGTKGYRPTKQNFSDFYVRARHYDSSTGRWPNVDPIGFYVGEPFARVQPYGYAFSCPNTRIDPSGLAPPPYPLNGAPNRPNEGFGPGPRVPDPGSSRQPNPGTEAECNLPVGTPGCTAQSFVDNNVCKEPPKTEWPYMGMITGPVIISNYEVTCCKSFAKRGRAHIVVCTITTYKCTVSSAVIDSPSTPTYTTSVLRGCYATEVPCGQISYGPYPPNGAPNKGHEGF